MKDQQTVWVTGASSGIGRSLVRKYFESGCNLILSSRREKDLEQVAVEFGIPENRFLVLPLDMEKTLEFDQKVKKAFDRFGRIDYLFCNAGISSRAAVISSPVEIDRKVMEINYFGTISLTKKVLPFMISQNSGHIIVTSSIMGLFSTPLRSAYAASKHALHGFFNALRIELADQPVDVTIICPGYIKTNVSMNAITEDGTPHNKMSRFQKNGMDPDQLAEKIYKAVSRKKRLVLIGGSELFAVWLDRFFPGMLYRILARKQRKNQFLE